MSEHVLVTGGTGLLGGELKTHLPNALFPTSTEFNVCNYDQMASYIEGKKVGVIFHAAAFTSPPMIDQDPVKALETNIIGTANIVKVCSNNKIRLIYISTDYVFDGTRGHYKENDPVHPVNKYAWSKLGGECAARLYDNALIVRTSFSENQFPYDKAFTDQWTSRQSVSETAKQLTALIDQDITGVIHVGGKRQTVFDYATSLDRSKTIGELSIQDVSFSVPKDTSLDCSHFQKLTKTNP